MSIAGRPMRLRRSAFSWGLGWLGLAVAAGAWQLGSHLANTRLFPGFAASARAGWHILSGQELSAALLPSVERTLLGFVISAVLGVLFGMIIGYWRVAREWTSAIFDFSRSLPTPLLIPAAVVIFGLGGRMVVVVIVSAAIWPVLINTANATASLDATLVDTARVLDLRGPRLLGRVILPAVSPQIFAGLRIAISISLAVMVVSEILGGGSGIGYYIATAQQSFQITDSYAGVLILCLLGWLFDTLLVWTESRLLAWQRGAVGGDHDV